MKWIFPVLLAGLLVASPFLTNRAMGTNEAYNYSLSVADAVTQFRAGEIPMLVGQTEYAFNGRIHPLRTAPGLAYATSLLDLLTFRQFGFWTLQNLVLALALIAAAGTCFVSLRASTPATPALAALLTGIYVMSPPVLAAAYGMDLYMTVLTVPFIPPALAANLLWLQGHRRAAVWLAVALAGCWLAHPPVGFWLSLASASLQAVGLFHRRMAWRDWGIWLGALLLFLLLAGFGLVSALTVTPTGQVTGRHGVTSFWPVLQEAFAHSLLPVSHTADQLGDFQLGYTLWLLILGGVLAARRQRCPVITGLLVTAGLLLCFTLPVPGITPWLWRNSPAMVVNLTGQWPMQRLYLLVAGLVVFAAAFIRGPVHRRQSLLFMLIATTLWVAWQAGHFVRRGFQTHRSPEETARSHSSGHIDLTPISYAFAALPGDFINGVRDPAQAFRLLAPFDLEELATNWSTPPSDASERITGLLVAPTGGDGRLFTAPALTLEPGRRYRIDFEFLVPPFAGRLLIEGPWLRRGYHLPSAGEARGFGMKPGNVPQLTLWTDLHEPETVVLAVHADEILHPTEGSGAVARFILSPIATDRLPVELLDLVPLRVHVRSPAPAYLETPRIFLPGYQATVNGRPVRVQRSPEGLALLPVPAGEARVELRYNGSPLLLASFWLGSLGWLGVAVYGLGVSIRPARTTPAPSRLTTAFTWLRRNSGRNATGLRAGMAILAAGAIVVALTWNDPPGNESATGPIRIRFALPRGETNRQQPLLVTGRPGAGMFVYVVYHDAQHVRIGIDVWNRFALQSEPIKTDYFADHEIVIDAPALYPPGPPRRQDLSAAAPGRPSRPLRVEFDGRTILAQEMDTYPSLPREVTVGLNRIGGSSCEPHFAGEILSVERLPLDPR